MPVPSMFRLWYVSVVLGVFSSETLVGEQVVMNSETDVQLLSLKKTCLGHLGDSVG